MQELRLVFIIVGGLAIAGLLIHGILKSKKETKSKFADTPANKKEPELSGAIADEDGFSSDTQIKMNPSERIEPGFGGSDSVDASLSNDDDPLFGSSDLPFSNKHQFKDSTVNPDDLQVLDPLALDEEKIEREPIFKQQDAESSTMRQVVQTEAQPVEMAQVKQSPEFHAKDRVDGDELIEPTTQTQDVKPNTEQQVTPKQTEEKDDNKMDVIVFHVHAAGDAELNGAELFPSMKQNGLLYGAMDIFHRHTDPSGTGKVLFSVANMMKPGTLAHNDPQTFNTKGISFFMTLPCFGEPEQNFKLMLRTAQQIADDLGANVLDDKRNLMTPDRIAAYRKQVRDFVIRQQAQQ